MKQDQIVKCLNKSKINTKTIKNETYIKVEDISSSFEIIRNEKNKSRIKEMARILPNLLKEKGLEFDEIKFDKSCIYLTNVKLPDQDSDSYQLFIPKDLYENQWTLINDKENKISNFDKYSPDQIAEAILGLHKYY